MDTGKKIMKVNTGPTRTVKTTERKSERDCVYICATGPDGKINQLVGISHGSYGQDGSRACDVLPPRCFLLKNTLYITRNKVVV